MSPINALAPISVEELLDDVFAEHVAGAPLTEAEALDVSLRIAPHQVGERSLVRNLLNALYRVNVLNVLQARRQPRMHAENLTVYGRCNGQVVKQIRKLLPYHLTPILALTLSKESVHLCSLAGLVIAS
jgi:hypothetical protein